MSSRIVLDRDFFADQPVIGMIHLAPLPGAPRARESLACVSERALADARALVAGGVDALMMENFGDTPFFPSAVPLHVVAAMTRLAWTLRQEFPKVPLGINVLRNDAAAALAVATAVDASFVRVNVLTGARVTDQGVVAGEAHTLLRERARLQAEHILICADYDVKHSAALASRPLDAEVQDLVGRGMADAVIVSGSGTGAAVSPQTLAAVKKAAGGAPVLIGSGASSDSLPSLASYADGYIVGTSFKHEGKVAAPVDEQRVRAFVAVRDGLRGAARG